MAQFLKFLCNIMVIFMAIKLGNCEGDSLSAAQVPIGDVRNCPTVSPIYPEEPLLRIEVLPGAGFDVLRGLDLGRVHAYNYFTCRVSDDGRYLLPDGIFIIPLKKSHLEVFSEYIEHWEQFKTTTSSTITLEAEFKSIISGKFSQEYQTVKTHMYTDKSIATRVQLRNVLVRVKIQPSTALHPTFKSRLMDIAASIQSNNKEFAHYLAELTVREYGTHYLTSVDAGAVLSQIDFIISKAIDNIHFTKKSVTASASADFLKKFKFGASYHYERENNHTEHFLNNRTYSEVYSWGGPPFGPNLTIEEWEKGIPNEMVAVDRRGDPLHYAISSTTLPELPVSMVHDVSFYISEAVSRYFKVNTHFGCTDKDSPNFDFHANVNDGSCNPPHTNFTFGGIYQTCTYITPAHEDLCTGARPMEQFNPLTGDMSCREPYVSVLLHNGELSHSFQQNDCHTSCHWLWGCDTTCHLNTYTTVVSYTAYWCVSPGHPDQNTGYLFGGFYTSSEANPFVGSQSCPRFFMPLRFGEDMQICVSNDYELGYRYSIPFAGFVSCSVGNPLALTNPTMENPESWPHDCPLGFTQHLVAVDNDCEINFCVRAGSFNQLHAMPSHLPPYRKLHFVKPNETDVLYLVGKYGNIWHKNKYGEWVNQNGEIMDEHTSEAGDNHTVTLDTNPAPFTLATEQPQQYNSKITEEGNSSSQHNISIGGIVGLVLASTLTITLVLGGIIFLLFCRMRKKTNIRSSPTILSNKPK